MITNKTEKDLLDTGLQLGSNCWLWIRIVYHDEGGTNRLIREPKTRPVSQEQLVHEVKGIYAGLIMVEKKCIEVDSKQAMIAQGDPASQPRLNDEQWQALISLHRVLLHEHHDFLLASQHPSASPALRELASKYAMPARMWRHGIHSFLELLRHWFPASLDHMLTFIYLAYSMLALLYETVPNFRDTWIECLGDLGRYRMAIEDDDIRDRDVWAGVAQYWYSKALDNAPWTGRLYHHIAISARPDSLMQLFYYTKSLCVAVPFPSTQDSILTLFHPVLADDGQQLLPALAASFVKAHGILFTKREVENSRDAACAFLECLNRHNALVTREFIQQGIHIAISNVIAMLGYGDARNPLMRAIEDAPEGTAKAGSEFDKKTMKSFDDAQYLAFATLQFVLQQIGNPNILPFVHVTLVFMRFISRRPRAMKYVEANFPWHLLTVMLNSFLTTYTKVDERLRTAGTPVHFEGRVRPLTDDFALRGLIWAEEYFPAAWFSEDESNDGERHLELASTVEVRKARILWLAFQICSAGRWISYDRDRAQFTVMPKMSPEAKRG